MNFFKNFHTQWTWFVKKHEWGVGLLITFIILALAFLGATVFVLGFLHNNEGGRIISNNSIQIIGGISALVFSYLYYIICIYASSYKNFKIAIDEAKKFAAEDDQCSPKISMLIGQTEQTKNPAKLNKWIENWKKLSSKQVEMQELEKEKEDIEKGIPLGKVNAKIEAKKEKIEELESQLV